MCYQTKAEVASSLNHIVITRTWTKWRKRWRFNFFFTGKPAVLWVRPRLLYIAYIHAYNMSSIFYPLLISILPLPLPLSFFVYFVTSRVCVCVCVFWNLHSSFSQNSSPLYLFIINIRSRLINFENSQQLLMRKIDLNENRSLYTLYYHSI